MYLIICICMCKLPNSISNALIYSNFYHIVLIHMRCRDIHTVYIPLYSFLHMYVHMYVHTYVYMYVLPTVCACFFQTKLNTAGLYLFLLLCLEYIHLAYHYYCGVHTL